MYVVVANVLAVGLGNRSDALKELPVRLIVMETGAEAIRSLRQERITTVVSRWGLVDMPQGRLLKNIIAANPAIPTIAFVTTGNPAQEIEARSLGVTVVLSEDIDDEYFCEAVCQLSGVSTVVGAAEPAQYYPDNSYPKYRGDKAWPLDRADILNSFEFDRIRSFVARTDRYWTPQQPKHT